MTRIEGIYQKYLKTLPHSQIKTLSPQKSQELELKLADAFYKKQAPRYSKINKTFLALVKDFFISISKI